MGDIQSTEIEGNITDEIDVKKANKDKRIKKKWKDELVKHINNENYRSDKPKRLAVLMSVPRKEQVLFNDALNELLNTDEYFLTDNGKIFSINQSDRGVAEYSVSAGKKFGFAITPEGQEDIFIHTDKAKGAMNKDVIIYKILSKEKDTGRTRGAVVQILKRGISKVVGTYHKNKNFGFLVPDNKKFEKDIYISNKNSKNLKDGDKLLVEIINYGDANSKPEGKVLNIIGHSNDPKVDILSIISEYPIEVEFPDEIYDSLKNISDEVSKEDIKDREDFRNMPIITIDGADAKDLDDAVSITKLENGNFELGVHIADVSHYVLEKTKLDNNAYKRGTSIYLVDRVIPMLPKKLSNGICSLHPNVDRLTLSCIMEVDKKGNVITNRVCRSVIHSKFRMTYDDVREIIEDKTPDLLEKYAPIIDILNDMNDLRVILGNKRKKRGTIDFDLPEAKVILDENGKTIDIKSYGRNIATNLIEEFMLLCNETVAEMAFWQEIPFIYRNHANPSEEKMERLDVFLKGFGYYFRRKDGKIHPSELQRILAEVEGKDEENVVSKMILRSMMQAVYQGENFGHFGLATKYYTHFTSPIRRYSDLLVHRFMKMVLDGKWSEDKAKFYDQKVERWAKQCSTTERMAEEMERETIALKKVEFMMDKIGEVYKGIVSGVTSWGIFIELENTVEGMVAVNKIEDDNYEFDKSTMSVIGKKKGKVYKLGDSVMVEVVKASKELREIDFKFV